MIKAREASESTRLAQQRLQEEQKAKEEAERKAFERNSEWERRVCLPEFFTEIEAAITKATKRGEKLVRISTDRKQLSELATKQLQEDGYQVWVRESFIEAYEGVGTEGYAGAHPAFWRYTLTITWS